MTQAKNLSALIIDDLAESRALYGEALRSKGFTVMTLPSVPAELFFQDRHFDLIVLDLNLGIGGAESEGLAHVERLARQCAGSHIVVLTAYGSIEKAVEAMRYGASSFLSKADSLDVFLSRIDEITEEKDRVYQAIEIQERCGLVGESRMISDLVELIRQVGPTESTVLVEGESGSGKELVTKGLHIASERSGGPLVAINCGAIPEALLESELFGSKKGAYTDAKFNRKGLFETAAGGTLFLDEIGELAPSLQAKLLRVLQEREFTPVGGVQPQKLNARIICATNRDLQARVKTGKFREDLYYRIAVITLKVGSLAERRDDIPILIAHFMDTFVKRGLRPHKMPSKAEIEKLQRYRWPGNIRELQNAVERSMILSKSPRLEIEHMLPLEDLQDGLRQASAGGDGSTAFGEWSLNYNIAKKQFEKRYLDALMNAAKGSVSAAAELSGQYRANIYRMARKQRTPLAPCRDLGGPEPIRLAYSEM